MRKMVRSIVLGAILASMACSMPARADSFYESGFVPITNNSGSAWAVSQQFGVYVEMVSGGAYDGMASFVFSNNGPIESNIAEIYWDWNESNPVLDPDNDNLSNNLSSNFGYFDALGGTWNLDPGVGNVNPNSLAAGNTVNFTALAGADEGNNPGLSVGEEVTFYMALASSKTWDNLLAALQSGQVRFGLHVRSIDGNLLNTSDSFYSPYDPQYDPYLPLPDAPDPDAPNPVVPVPAAAGLGFLGMAIVGVMRRKKS